MNHAYARTEVLVLPQDLQDFAWSAPMRDLAAKVGLSDVGLKKLLKANGVVTPPQGYWNRVHAGKPVPMPAATRAASGRDRPHPRRPPFRGCADRRRAHAVLGTVRFARGS